MSIEKKLLDFQSQVDAIKKDSKNPFFKSMYVDINGVLKAIQPLLTKLGISITQCPQVVDGVDILRTVLYDAEKPESRLESNTRLIMAKQDMQQYGGAITYARRYALISMLGLEAEDDDGNLATGKTKQEKPNENQSQSEAAENKIKNILYLLKDEANPNASFKKYTGVKTKSALLKLGYNKIAEIENKISSEMGL